MIKISSNGYESEVEETDSWQETKDRIIGAAHSVILARDRNKKIKSNPKPK